MPRKFQAFFELAPFAPPFVLEVEAFGVLGFLGLVSLLPFGRPTFRFGASGSAFGFGCEFDF